MNNAKASPKTGNKRGRQKGSGFNSKEEAIALIAPEETGADPVSNGSPGPFELDPDTYFLFKFMGKGDPALGAKRAAEIVHSLDWSKLGDIRVSK